MSDRVLSRRLPTRHVVALGAACLLVGASCSSPSGAEDYVSFGNELSMLEKYPSLPDLPVELAVFEAQLARLPVAWAKAEPAHCPDPESLDRNSRTRLSGCLFVSDPPGAAPGQRYVAFVDVESKVVLVENVFRRGTAAYR